MEIKVTIIYPSDPLGPKIGGAETWLKNFITFSPKEFHIEYIGISSDKKIRPPGTWHKCVLGKKQFQFYPLFTEKDENKRTPVPLSLRFTVSLELTKLDLSGRVLLFNRIEPAMIFTRLPNPRLAIIHTSVKNHIDKKISEVLWGKIPWLYRRFESFLFPHFDHIFTVSHGTLAFYKSKYKNLEERFSFLENSVDTSIFFPGDRERRLLKMALSQMIERDLINCTWILFVGRLQEAKAPLRLLDSFHSYYKMNPSVSLIIIGEGDLKEDMKKYKECLGLSASVFFIPPLPQSILADFYRASDVLLLTSNFEGMPMCALESLSCGTPVVSTNVGEIRRIVKDGYSGEVVESFHPKAISIALKKVLSRPEVYTRFNCQAAASAFLPQKSFLPLFEKIRRLHIERYPHS